VRLTICACPAVEPVQPEPAEPVETGSAAAAQDVQRGIRRDAGQPELQGSRTLQGWWALVEAKEDVLADVLGIVAVTHDAERDPVHVCPVPLVENRERTVVTVPGGLEQFAVAHTRCLEHVADSTSLAR